MHKVLVVLADRVVSTMKEPSQPKATESPSEARSDRPIVCCLEEDKDAQKPRMFKVVRSKGKALASGGFGVTICDDDDEATTTSSQNYLFVEEALFLHEKGLLSAFWEGKLLDTSQLYQFLLSMGVSLPIYRVYSHLRSQDFRVLRHNPERYEIILCQQQKGPSRMLRKQIRRSIQNAPPPKISKPAKLCWDVYNPNSNFAKSHPGFPDFYATATFYNLPSVTFSDLRTLLKEDCHGIPLKVATVSDSGTVAMFGVTDYGIPPLVKTANL